MQLHRLQGRKVNATIQRKGKAWKGQAMAIRWLPGVPPSHGRPRKLAEGVYLGTYASAALDASAVRRNRMRRRCREALRMTIERLPERASLQLLLTPRAASLDAPFEALLAEAAAFFSTLRS